MEIRGLELTRPLGRGGLGEVWLARHPSLEGDVAAKLLRRKAVDDLLGEVHALATVDHPHIVRLFDYGRFDDGRWCIVMQFAPLGTLAQLPRPVDFALLTELVDQILQALAHAHANDLLHGDLKPSNVLRAAPDRTWLADFGLARRLREHEPGPVAGTPQFMAPEVLLGHPSTPASDLYSLGCLVWWLTTGHAPFPTPNAALNERLAAFAPPLSVPDGLERWLRHLLAKSPDDRYDVAADALHGWRDLGSVALQGPTPRPLPVVVWQTPPRPPAAEPPREAGLRLFAVRPPPFVGRVDERTRLWNLLAQVTHGSAPHAVALLGPSGCGKSELARWLTVRAHELGAAWVWPVRHDPTQPDALRVMLRRHVGDGRDLATEYGLDLDGEVLARWIAGEAVPGDARWSALGRLVEAITEARPLLLWLDDVAWGVESLRLVRHLRGRVLVVMTASHETLAEHPAARAALDELAPETIIELGPLDDARTAELVAGLAGLEAPLVARVASRAAGNPMFAVELIRHWSEQGALVPTDQGFRLNTPTAAGCSLAQRDPVGLAVEGIPDSVAGIWERRLEQLLEDLPAHEALERAAVLGIVVSDAEWIRSLDSSPDTAKRLHRSLVSRGLATPTDETGRWRFTHALFREVVLAASRVAGRWTEHHAVCADIVATLDPGAADRIGRHLLHAGQAVAAAGPLLAGARRHVASGLYRMAESLLRLRDEGLEEAGHEPNDPLRAQGDAWCAGVIQLLGRYEEARELARTAFERLEGHPERGVAARTIAEVALMRGQLDEAECWFTEMRQLSIGDPALLRFALRGLGMIATHRGQPDRATALLSEALALPATPGRSFDVVLALAYLAYQGGDVDELRTWTTRAFDEARALGSRAGMGMASNLEAEGLRTSGQLEEAEAAYRRAYEHLEAAGSAETVVVRINLGLVLLEAGNDHEAAIELEHGLRTSVSEDRRLIAATCRLGLLAAQPHAQRASDHMQALRRDLDGIAVTDRDLARLARMAAERSERWGAPKRAHELREWASCWSPAGSP